MENQTNDALPRRGNSRRFFLSWQAAEEGSQGVGEGREQPFGHVYAYGRYGWVVKIWPQSRSLSLSLSLSLASGSDCASYKKVLASFG